MALDRGGHSGLALGAWGAVQATAAGGAIALGGADARRRSAARLRTARSARRSTGPASATVFVYHIEIVLLFATLVAIGPLVRAATSALHGGRASGWPIFPASHSAETSHADRRHHPVHRRGPARAVRVLVLLCRAICSTSAARTSARATRSKSDRAPSVRVQGYPADPGSQGVPPAPTATRLSAATASDTRPRSTPSQTAAWPGAPLEPTGNPHGRRRRSRLLCAARRHAGRTIDGAPHDRADARRDRLLGSRTRDPDPRGMPVVGCRRRSGRGSVGDIWVDRSEPQIRFWKWKLGAGGAVLLPVGLRARRQAAPAHRGRVDLLRAASSPASPRLSNPDQVTLAEEDRITGYYGGGTCTPSRRGGSRCYEHDDFDGRAVPGLPETAASGRNGCSGRARRDWRAPGAAGLPRRRQSRSIGR